MGWGEKRDMLVAENAALLREVDLLREMLAENKEDRADLKSQLRYTQEALIAKESPEAYRDKQDAEAAAELDSGPNAAEAENIRRQGVRTDAATSWLQNMEENLFKDADDMIQQLTRATGVPMGQSESLHGNEES